MPSCADTQQYELAKSVVHIAAGVQQLVGGSQILTAACIVLSCVSARCTQELKLVAVDALTLPAQARPVCIIHAASPHTSA